MKQLNLLKTLFLLCALVVGSLNSWADEVVTLTQENLGLTGSYSSNVDKTIGGITYNHTDLMKSTTNIQAKASTGVLSNKTPYSGDITSVNITHSGTARATTIYGSADGSNWSQVATGSGSVSADFSTKSFRYFKITRGSNAAYWEKVTISYKAGGISVPVTGVTLDPTELTMTAGETETLTATVAPAEATNKGVTWESSDKSVATVDAGVVTAVAAGTCTITVTTVDGSFTATCDVTVNAVAVAATLDFSDTAWGFPASYTLSEGSYTNGGYTIVVGEVAADGHKALMSTGSSPVQVGLIFGKDGAKITFPTFDFNVSKIKVYGRSGAATGVKFNIFVDDVAVSTEVTSSAVNHEFEIASDKQTKGTVYVLKLTTTDKNCQITKIEIFGYDNKEVTAAGYATYVTEHNVEFAEGDAYAVTIDGGVAKLNAVTAVPAGTPVLLKGEGTKKPAVLEDAPAAPAANDLKEGDGTTPTNAYVLANQTKGVGFYKWKGSNIPAGKVYLDASGVAAHEFISIDLENGEATGINEIAADKTFNGEFFNLAGQRVAQPTKGLYIVNGKKIVIK